MKKTLAILLTVVMLFALAVPVMAASSPAAGKKLTVVAVTAPEAKPQATTVTVAEDVNDGTMTLTYTAEAKHKDAAFATWAIYRRDGSVAVAGTDYTLAGGTALKDLSITIIPRTDLIVAANYGDKTTDIKDAQAAFQSKSEPTGDVVAALAVVMFAALAGTVVCKKQLAK